MKTVNQLAALVSKAGFESYGNFRTDEPAIQCEIFTCTKGKYCGENIEVLYNYNTGTITNISQYCQFPVNHPHYSPVKLDLSK